MSHETQTPLIKTYTTQNQTNAQDMIQTLKSSLKPQLIPSPFKTTQINHRPTSLRFIQATPMEAQQQQQQQQEQDVKKSTEDVMSHSFGEGYKTRSDEEGFGGVYGGNQSEEEETNVIDVNHPEYDKSQGCEVKEKEQARNQMEASS